MSILLYTLSKINNFIAHRNVFHQLNPILQTPQDEYEFAEELITLPEASSYVEHKNWINFTKLNFPRPIYLNLIRHPIQKVLSAYYYLRSPEVYAHYAKGQPQLASMSTENQTMTFNECVKRKLYTLQPSHINNTAKAEKEWIFFNRLEKVGSQSMMVLLQDLATVNNFVTHHNRPNSFVRLVYPSDEEQAIADELDEVEYPMSYTEHTNWINFTNYDLPKPIYVNLIRHPIQRVMSAYYFIRKPDVHAFYVKKDNRSAGSKEYFEMSFSQCVREAKRQECIFESHIKYNSDWRRAAVRFCGNKNVCKQFNSQIATQIAKHNIEQDYAVVGSWEDTNITLTVLEHYIPRFFRSATKIFYSDGNNNKFHQNATPHKTELDPDVEAKLKIQFGFEIELYHFCKQRLYRQYIAIQKELMMKKFRENQ